MQPGVSYTFSGALSYAVLVQEQTQLERAGLGMGQGCTAKPHNLYVYQLALTVFKTFIISCV